MRASAKINDLPPDEIWENSDFIIGLELKNKGPFSITEGLILVSGFDPEYITIEENRIQFELQGKSPAYPEGDYKVINIKAKNIYFPQGHDEHPAPFTIKAFYDYQTEATVNVCIDPDIYTPSYLKTTEQ